jgi:two-component system, sensor histidine kinase PdtaS
MWWKLNFIKHLHKEFQRLFWFSLFSMVLLPILFITISLVIKDEYSRLVISDIASAFLNLMATVALIFAAISSRKISKKYFRGWGILAFAQLSFTLGDIIWGIIEIGLKTNPFPSAADIPYLLFYPLFLLGISIFPLKRLNKSEWIKRAMEISIVMMASVLAYWIFLINPMIQAGSESTLLETIVSVAVAGI